MSYESFASLRGSRKRPSTLGDSGPQKELTAAPQSIVQNSFPILQGSANCLQSALEMRQILKNRGAILPVHHGSQKVALTYEQLIVMD